MQPPGFLQEQSSIVMPFRSGGKIGWIFADQLPRGGLDDRIDLSLSAYRQGSAAASALPECCDLGDAYLVGLGAIGNGAVWALSRVPGLAGVLHLVDHENADLSNLQRYVMITQDDVGRRKVRLARAFFTQGTLKVRAHPQRWGDYVDGRRKRAFERVAVALDTAEDRIALQASLPKWIVNAWTQDVDLGVSRHDFATDGACLACLYMPTGAVKNEDERVAEELRIPEAHQEIRTLLQTNQPVSEPFVQRVAAGFGVPFEALEKFVGQPVRTFYRNAICGGLMVGLTGGTSAGTAVVPMAFQSALAGIMLAADLVKDSAGMPAASTTTTRINLLRPVAPVLGDPRAKDTSGRCICCDKDFLDSYRRKYETRHLRRPN
jgi:hypothetical protein